MSFKFNFGGNDSDSEGDDGLPTPQPAPQKLSSVQKPPKHHSLEDLVHSLPQNISYSTLNVSASIRIPRRELYDVRMQLMAEDKLDASMDGEEEQMEKSTLAELGDEDIRTSFYEGGLKSWECSVDLVRHLAAEDEEGRRRRRSSVLELGCGTSLPSLYLFQSILRALHHTESPYLSHNFTLADYNLEVLRLVTLPNLFLSWAISRTPSSAWDPEGDFDVTEVLRTDFTVNLQKLGITIDFVSGGWCDDMLEILSAPYDLVLASETIYSLASTGLFTDVLLGALKREGRGLVAAKQIYFGVGGSVADFVSRVEGRGGWGCRSVREEREVGVGRSIIEVKSSGL